jgi:hypothetical protein
MNILFNLAALLIFGPAIANAVADFFHPNGELARWSTVWQRRCHHKAEVRRIAAGQLDPATEFDFEAHFRRRFPNDPLPSPPQDVF